MQGHLLWSLVIPSAPFSELPILEAVQTALSKSALISVMSGVMEARSEHRLDWPLVKNLTSSLPKITILIILIILAQSRKFVKCFYSFLRECFCSSPHCSITSPALFLAPSAER